LVGHKKGKRGNLEEKCKNDWKLKKITNNTGIKKEFTRKSLGK